ncbi:metallophosphoesterase family protein [Alkalibacterium kapii]|uniref:Calcineurin-like phosphoesterase domain-containing protein n=1 Tax=Alkalibacterium kapii TaxID=426704 RepID=A0A511ATK1_9LACT|nr:DNA repair exonuclease [Alkalibacterium kapii]GEK91456.1 hypothetical protein AKA01nite_10780 [Alkalibacterium kapii]
MVKYIHAADIHLDSPFKGLKNIPEALFDRIKASTFNSFKNLIDAALYHQVDFVLLAGDIYDLEDRSIRAQVFLRKELERLNEADIDVFIIHGNHDYLTNDELHLSLPENVFVFGPKVETELIETRRHEKVAISGFSYDRNWVKERKITEYPSRDHTSDFHIGILHGFMEGHNTAHARYAPFTLNELREKDYDYWALGHIHKKQQLSKEPLIYYSGNTQGRHKNETGEKGCLLIELKTTGESVTFIPTADIKWQSIALDLTLFKSMAEIFDEIKKSLPNKKYSDTLIDLNLKISKNTPETIVERLQDPVFLDNLQVIEDTSFTYIVSSKITHENNEDLISSLVNAYPMAFRKALKAIDEEDEFKKITHDFFSKYAYAKYVEKDQENIKETSLDLAKQILMQDLGEEISHEN